MMHITNSVRYFWNIVFLKILLLSTTLWGITASQSCTLVDSCTCDMDDGTGQINLHSIALDGQFLTDSAFTSNGGDGYYYKYNPCNGFRLGGYTDLAIAQTDVSTGYYVYDLGNQTSADFAYAEDSGLSIHYFATDGVRQSRVKLICEPNVNDHKFEVVGELITLEYDFILTSTCACPGLCDGTGVIPDLPTVGPPPPPGATCNYIDSCTCEMSDGSGRVNLHGTALEGASLYDAAFSIQASDGWYYKYNPCNGYSMAGFYDLAIFQASDPNPTWGYDLGVQSKASFNYTEGSGLTIHYTANNAERTSRVLLTCDPGTTEHTLEFLGELQITEYDFIMTSPCACPGACDNNGVIGTQTTPPPSGTTCNFIDSCTCDMSDGTGQINLHALAKTGIGSQYDSQFTVLGYDGWYYKYNPCNGFAMHTYTDLAVYQTDSYESYGFDLGVQSSTSFVYTDTNGLAIHYISAENVRSTKILLVCEPGINAHKLEFVGEIVILEYEFILTTPCACPGMCDNDGPTIPLPTPGPGTGEGDGTCKFIDSCTCDMADGSGKINLKSLSLQEEYLYDSAFTEYGSDGYYYKYNPCYGFYFNGYYDTALAQSYDFYGSYGLDLGTQSSAYFNYTEGSGLAINYKSADRFTLSRVLLICEPNTDAHKFQFIGELVWYEYDFTLTTPCACPGGCDDYGVLVEPEGAYCNAVDSCTCDMSDGSGRINLKSLALTGDSISDAAFTYDGLDGWLYKYNPCNGFSAVYYYDLALAQVNVHGTSGHDLGTQDSVKFRYSESAGLSIHYTSDDRVRESRVLLLCDPLTKEAVFEFVGELVTLEYEFILKSACACPGGCNDFGIIGGEGEVGGNNLPDTIHVNVEDSDTSAYLWTDVGGVLVALIFHDLFLVLAIALVILIAKRTMSLCFDPTRNGLWSSNYDRFKDITTGQPSA